MNKQRIKIERLEIRLRGVSAETARAAVSGLGQNLLAHLSTSASFSARRRSTTVAELRPDMLRVAAGTRPAELQSAIAERVAKSIRSKLG